MGISKGRVDLDGPSVALQRPLHVLHFFQCVAHIRVGVSKCGADSVRDTEKQCSILGLGCINKSFTSMSPMFFSPLINTKVCRW